MSGNPADFWSVVAHEHGIVWCTRSRTPYPSVTALDETLVLLNLRLDAFCRAEHSLLLDLREGPLPTPGEWMTGALLHHRRRLTRGFRRVGFLVRIPEQAEPLPRPTSAADPEILLFRDPDRARGALRLQKRPFRVASG